MGKILFRLVEISIFAALSIGMINGLLEGWLVTAFICFVSACFLLPIFITLDVAVSEGSKHYKATCEQLDQPRRPHSESYKSETPSEEPAKTSCPSEAVDSVEYLGMRFEPPKYPGES